MRSTEAARVLPRKHGDVRARREAEVIDSLIKVTNSLKNTDATVSFEFVRVRVCA